MFYIRELFIPIILFFIFVMVIEIIFFYNASARVRMDLINSPMHEIQKRMFEL